MSERVTLEAQKRESTGTGNSRAYRNEGLLPAVIYGGNAAVDHVLMEEKVFTQELHKEGFFAKLFDIKVDGKNQMVLTKDVQFHPVTERPLHADFVRVDEKSKIVVSIPVHFEGKEKSPGLKRGGVLNVVRAVVGLYCSPANIPTHVTVDLTTLNVGETVHFSAINLPEGVEQEPNQRDYTIANILAPRLEKAVEETADEEAEGEEAEGEEGSKEASTEE